MSCNSQQIVSVDYRLSLGSSRHFYSAFSGCVCAHFVSVVVVVVVHQVVGR